MLVQRLVDHFDKYSLLPIDVNAVRDQLVDMGVQDRIRFHFVKMDPLKLRGILHRYIAHAAPYANPTFCSDILLPAEMGDEDEAWKRLVAVKELLHIADCANLTAESNEAVDNLFVKFSMPPEMREQVQQDEKKSYLNDQIRIYLALAILIPLECRQALRALYPERLSAREIADIAKVPTRYIDMVMADRFEKSIRIYLDWEQSEQPPAAVRAVR